MRGKFSFLYVDIWFDVTNCKFIVKNSSFEMLVMFSPTFVADKKIIFVYNFVAPLKNAQLQSAFWKKRFNHVSVPCSKRQDRHHQIQFCYPVRLKRSLWLSDFYVFMENL